MQLTEKQKAARRATAIARVHQSNIPTLDELPQADTSDLERAYKEQFQQDSEYENQY